MPYLRRDAGGRKSRMLKNLLRKKAEYHEYQ